MTNDKLHLALTLTHHTGNYNSFKKLYETPILKSRAPGCSTKERELGEARLEQLLETAKSFVLRRDASILKNYLPPKCTFTPLIFPYHR